MDNAVWLIIKEIVHTQKQTRENLITIVDILEEYKYKIRDIEKDIEQLEKVYMELLKEEGDKDDF